MGAGLVEETGVEIEQYLKEAPKSNYNIRGPGYSHTNGSSSRENSNASSPRHDPDTKPLLVVTAVTEGHSPTVSQSSLQFIDEEPVKKVVNRLIVSAIRASSISYHHPDSPTPSTLLHTDTP
ncbi:hypothetical protein C0Q70_03926 [Pomacea canaliculata]|uniref:Uncharacterized protein n=1 Tax=Pomacea canaliculata TaxID=400727 RepID=A0A2T7PU28_POMCA|nr:hypothetical protein C0Q70_03926 [Pomacea canaliculata]